MADGQIYICSAMCVDPRRTREIKTYGGDAQNPPFTEHANNGAAPWVVKDEDAAIASGLESMTVAQTVAVEFGMV